MDTADILTIIGILGAALGVVFGLGMRWAKSQTKADQSQEQLKVHKEDCKKRFSRIHERLKDLESTQTGRKTDSGDILNELSKIIKNTKRRKPSTESDDGES